MYSYPQPRVQPVSSPSSGPAFYPTSSAPLIPTAPDANVYLSEQMSMRLNHLMHTDLRSGIASLPHTPLQLQSGKLALTFIRSCHVEFAESIIAAAPPLDSSTSPDANAFVFLAAPFTGKSIFALYLFAFLLSQHSTEELSIVLAVKNYKTLLVERLRSNERNRRGGGAGDNNRDKEKEREKDGGWVWRTTAYPENTVAEHALRNQRCYTIIDGLDNDAIRAGTTIRVNEINTNSLTDVYGGRYKNTSLYYIPSWADLEVAYAAQHCYPDIPGTLIAPADTAQPTAVVEDIQTVAARLFGTGWYNIKRRDVFGNVVGYVFGDYTQIKAVLSTLAVIKERLDGRKFIAPQDPITKLLYTYTTDSKNRCPEMQAMSEFTSSLVKQINDLGGGSGKM